MWVNIPYLSLFASILFKTIWLLYGIMWISHMCRYTYMIHMWIYTGTGIVSHMFTYNITCTLLLTFTIKDAPKIVDENIIIETLDLYIIITIISKPCQILNFFTSFFDVGDTSFRRYVHRCIKSNSANILMHIWSLTNKEANYNIINNCTSTHIGENQLAVYLSGDVWVGGLLVVQNWWEVLDKNSWG